MCSGLALKSASEFLPLELSYSRRMETGETTLLSSLTQDSMAVDAVEPLHLRQRDHSWVNTNCTL